MRLMYDAYELPVNSLFNRMTVDKMNYLPLDTFTYTTTAFQVKTSVLEELFVKGDMQEATDNVLLVLLSFLQTKVLEDLVAVY